MRYRYIYVLCMLVCFLGACKKEKKPALKEHERQEALIVDKDMKPVKSRPVKRNDNPELDKTSYISEISLMPDEALAMVKADDGMEYVDNRVSLKLNSVSGRKIIDREFTKRDFSSMLNAGFKKNGLLEGFIFDKAENGRFHYMVSICYPQSDMCMYIRMSIDKNGNFLLSPADDLSTTFTEE